MTQHFHIPFQTTDAKIEEFAKALGYPDLPMERILEGLWEAIKEESERLLLMGIEKARQHDGSDLHPFVLYQDDDYNMSWFIGWIDEDEELDNSEGPYLDGDDAFVYASGAKGYLMKEHERNEY